MAKTKDAPIDPPAAEPTVASEAAKAELSIDELGPNPTLGEILEYEARKRAS